MDVNAILFNQINELTTEVNTQLMQRPVVRGTATEAISWVRTGAKGTTKFPVRFFGNKAKKRLGYEEVGHTSQEVVNLQHTIEEWAPDGEAIPRGTQVQDIYGVFENGLPQILEQAQNEYEAHLAAFLGNGQSAAQVVTAEGLEVGGPTAYDGLSFFNDAHLVNPNRAAVGNFDNFRNGVAMSKASLLTAFGFLDSILGPDGRPMRMPGEIVVAVTTEEQYDIAATYLFGTIRTAAVGNAAASESNVPSNGLSGGQGGGLLGRARLIKIPDLAAYDSGKGWYAFKIASPTWRPMMLGIAEPPQVYIEGLSPNDTSRVTKNVIRYGWRGFWGFGYGWPQLAIKFVEP